MSNQPVNLKMNQLQHRAFDRELGRIQVVVNAAGDDPAELPDGLVERWRFFSEQLKIHHEAEDRFIWPAVEKRSQDPSERVIIEAMENEHVALHKQLDMVDSFFDALEQGDLADLSDLRIELQDLKVIATGHMGHEEHDGVRIAVKYVQPEDMAAYHKYLRAAEDATLVLPWMCDGAPEEDQKEVWGMMPWFVRLFAKPLMTRKYRSFLTGLN